MIDFSAIKDVTIPEGKVKSISRNGVVIWSAPVEGSSILPNEYQQVAWIKAAKGVQAYINLGFAFDTAATIYIEQYLDAAPSWVANEQTYIFGAANSTGALRCMFTAPENNNGAFAYGSSGSAYVYSQGKYIYAGKNSVEIVFKKGDIHWKNLDTGEVATTKTTNGAFTMTDNLYLLAQNYKGSPRFNGTNGHERCVGRFSYHDKSNTLICDLYPCYRKSDGVIGMYDLVRGLFLTNVGSGSFTKGTNV